MNSNKPSITLHLNPLDPAVKAYLSELGKKGAKARLDGMSEEEKFKLRSKMGIAGGIARRRIRDEKLKKGLA